MKRRNKTIFRVSCDVKKGDEIFDVKDFKVMISQGTTGYDMQYALVALLNVVLAHEEVNDNSFTVDGFMNYLTMLLKDTRIGVSKE